MQATYTREIFDWKRTKTGIEFRLGDSVRVSADFPITFTPVRVKLVIEGTEEPAERVSESS